MTQVQIDLVDVLGHAPTKGDLVWIRAAKTRSSAAGAVVVPAAVPIEVHDGPTVELEPGPARVRFELKYLVADQGREFPITVPDEGPVTLRDLLEEAYQWDPLELSAFAQLRAAATDAAGTATDAAGTATTAAQQTGQDRQAVAQDRTAVEDTRALLDEAYDQSQAGMALPPRLMESALKATYGSRDLELAAAFGPAVRTDAPALPGTRLLLGSLGGHVWSALSGALQRSTSVEGPWTTVATLPGVGSITDIKPIGGGEVMVARGGTSAGLWRSTGWNPADPSATTWVQVLDTVTAPNQFTWATDPVSGWVTAAVYIGSGDMSASRYGWLSEDNGSTFAVVYDIDAAHPTMDPTTSHVHHLVLDPGVPNLPHPRLWMSYHTAGSTDVIRHMYSDDKGVTWTRFTTDDHHPVVGLPVRGGMIFDTDTSPTGLFLVRHTTNPANMKREPLWIIRRPGGVTMSGWATRYARGDGGVWHVAFRSSVPGVPGCVISTDGVHAGETAVYEPLAPTDTVNVLGMAVHNRRMVVTSSHSPTSGVTQEVPSPEPPRGVPATDQGQTTGGVAGVHSTSSGLNSYAALRSVAVGETSSALTDGTAVGYTSSAAANGAAFGAAAIAGDGGVSVGRLANSVNGVSVGIQSDSATNSLAVGRSTKALGADATALGCFALAPGAQAVAVGASAQGNGQWSVALGRGAVANAPNSIAIGRGVTVAETHTSSVGLGLGTATTAAAQVHIGGRHLSMVRVAAVATPLANQAALAIMDNGAGKMQLVARFPTGAIQVISTEP